MLECLGLNPYKAVELWENYRPVIPVDFQNVALYAEPDTAIMAKVKDEKLKSCSEQRLGRF